MFKKELKKVLKKVLKGESTQKSAQKSAQKSKFPFLSCQKNVARGTLSPFCQKREQNVQGFSYQ